MVAMHHATNTFVGQFVSVVQQAHCKRYNCRSSARRPWMSIHSMLYTLDISYLPFSGCHCCSFPANTRSDMLSTPPKPSVVWVASTSDARICSSLIRLSKSQNESSYNFLNCNAGQKLCLWLPRFINANSKYMKWITWCRLSQIKLQSEQICNPTTSVPWAAAPSIHIYADI